MATAVELSQPAITGMHPLARAFKFHVVLAVCLAFMVALFCDIKIADPDLGYHLRNAQHLVETHHFIRHDLYSFTAANEPYVAFEWGAELPYYAAYKWFGLRGVYIVSLLLLQVIAVMIFYIAYKEGGNVKAAFVYGVLGVLLAVVNFGPRTIQFGWLLLLILLRILQRIREGKSGPWWAIPLLFGLWANTHGTWLIGLIMFGLSVAPGFISRTPEGMGVLRWTSEQRKRLIAAGVGSVCALFANPYGYKLVMYPFDLAFKQKLAVASVAEWASVDFHDGRGKLVLALLIVLMATLVFSKIRPRIDELLLTAFALYMGLTHVRFLFLTGILLGLVLAPRWQFIPGYNPAADKPKLNAVLVAGLVLAILLGCPTGTRLEQEMSRSFPDGAIRYLQTNAPRCRLFNDYTWGGYLIWKAPGIPVFIDGRADIYEHNGTLKEYADAAQIRRPLEVLDQYKIDHVLMPNEAPIVYVLDHSAEWKRVYKDDRAAIFARANR